MIILGSVHHVKVSKEQRGLWQFTTYLLFSLSILKGQLLPSTYYNIAVVYTYENVSGSLPVICRRFMYHSGGAKLEMPVEFPLRLEAKDVCSISPPNTQPLHLAAIVCHFGSKAI